MHIDFIFISPNRLNALFVNSKMNAIEKKNKYSNGELMNTLPHPWLCDIAKKYIELRIPLEGDYFPVKLI